MIERKCQELVCACFEAEEKRVVILGKKGQEFWENCHFRKLCF